MTWKNSLAYSTIKRLKSTVNIFSGQVLKKHPDAPKFCPRETWAQKYFDRTVASTQSQNSNHENKMEEPSKRYKKIDFLGEGQV